MTWTQTATPNPDVPYYGGLCEGYVEGTVGEATKPYRNEKGDWTTDGVYPTAAAAWKASKGNHTDLPPKGVYVPVFFTLGNNKAGHVALSLPDGRIASSTQAGYHTKPYIHPNLQDLINVYSKANGSCKYLGWSEYIGNKKVVELQEYTMKPTPLGRLVEDMQGRKVDADDKKKFLGKDPNDAIMAISNFMRKNKKSYSQMKQKYEARIRELESQLRKQK